MNELQNFVFEGNSVRTVLVDDKPFFVGNDVATAIGYSNPQKALRDHVKPKYKLTERIVLSGQKREVILISEPGIYQLAGQSKLPSAEPFQDWVYEEVLPTIQHHGAYMTSEVIEKTISDPDFIIGLATQLKVERTGRLIAEQQVQELKPKATYYDRILSNKALVAISVIAKDYGMSGTAMNILLHRLGVQYKQGKTWLLYSKYQTTGWTQSETTMVKRKDGTEKAVLNTKWTQKGRLGLYELLKLNNYLPLIEQDLDIQEAE
ncbi:phage antirepressor [Lapidilactobacillus gannanensis]|uniref:Phage antirepressor n=1 Tax=Lapidilactobacillus gannanensis TaxID=2486002 RepID=A0ABW4BMU8_9LACO|nr:phage antirepressor [Lapidilactobacillus gannanensis]